MLQRRRLVYRRHQRTVRLGDGVAVRATVARQKAPSQIELRRTLKRVHVTLAARRLEITRRQYRLLPCLGAVVRLLDSCGSSLTVMANHAAKLGERVGHRRVRTEGFPAHIIEARFLQGHVAGCATVHHALLGNPYLVDAAFKSPPQTRRIRPCADQPQIVLLVMAALTEEVFGGSNGGDDRQQHAHRRKPSRSCSHEETPDSSQWIS